MHTPMVNLFYRKKNSLELNILNYSHENQHHNFSALHSDTEQLNPMCQNTPKLLIKY